MDETVLSISDLRVTHSLSLYLTRKSLVNRVFILSILQSKRFTLQSKCKFIIIFTLRTIVKSSNND